MITIKNITEKSGITKPGVSVILPFFRPGRKLEDAIKSITDQTFPDWELILVNNNACEVSSSIARRWKERDQRIKIFHETVQSVASAMNRGLRHARADLIARMDADDISLPLRLQKQVDHMSRHRQIGAVASQSIFNTDVVKSKGFSLYVDWQNRLITHEEHFLSRFVESPLAQPTIMFRKKLIDLYGCYNTGDLPEDYELWLRWFEKGVRFYKIPEPLVQWNDHSERLTRTHTNYSPDSFMRIRYEYLARWLRKHIAVENTGTGKKEMLTNEKIREDTNPAEEQPEISRKKIIVCGSSRNITRKAKILSDLGVKIFGFTDVITSNRPDINFIPYSKLTDPKKYFILNLISKRGVGNAIRDHFLGLGFVEGRDLLLAG